MANVDNILFPQVSISRQLTCVLLFISLAHTQNIVGKTLTFITLTLYAQFNAKELAKS